jgi:hypothetical protein
MKRVTLPQIIRQADVGILETADGERITVQEYERLRQRFDLQENTPEPPTRDIARTTNNEQAAVRYENGELVAEDHPSQNVPVPGVHGQMRPNPDLVPGAVVGGFVDTSEVDRPMDDNNMMTDENGRPVPAEAVTREAPKADPNEKPHEAKVDPNEKKVDLDNAAPVGDDQDSTDTRTVAQAEADAKAAEKQAKKAEKKK